VIKATFGNHQLGFDIILFPFDNAATGTPGQKLWIGFDVIDQIEHLLRRIFD
jgi:hypothetical protein